MALYTPPTPYEMHQRTSPLITFGNISESSSVYVVDVKKNSKVRSNITEINREEKLIQIPRHRFVDKPSDNQTSVADEESEPQINTIESYFVDPLKKIKERARTMETYYEEHTYFDINFRVNHPNEHEHILSVHCFGNEVMTEHRDGFIVCSDERIADAIVSILDMKCNIQAHQFNQIFNGFGLNRQTHPRDMILG